MKNRELIFVSNAIANGGAARVLCVLANHFSAAGKKVGILSFIPREDEYPLDPVIDKLYGPPGDRALTKIRRMLWIREVVRSNPDATIIAFEYFANMQTLLACVGLQNRIIVSERNDPARVGSGFPNDTIRKALYRRAHALVCQTDDAASYFPESIRKQVILNPLKPDLPLPFTGLRRDTVVTFSRLEKQKNLGMLIRAFAKFREEHPGYSLEIYGDGSERSTLEALAESLHIKEVVSISASRGDIHEVVRDCAMFVLSSDYEGLSNSMLEALALGLPTICTDCPCGGARTVINDGSNGILIPVGSESALVAAMGRIASDKTFAAKLSENGRLIRQELSPNAIALKWQQLLPGNGERRSDIVNTHV